MMSFISSSQSKERKSSYECLCVSELILLVEAADCDITDTPVSDWTVSTSQEKQLKKLFSEKLLLKLLLL